MKTASKTTLLAGSILCLAVSLSAQQSSNQSQTKKEKEVKMLTLEATQQNTECVRKIYEVCFNERKLDILNELVDKDYTGGLFNDQGPAGFAATVRTLIQGFPDIHWTVEDLFSSGDKVAIRVSWTGTHLGLMRGFQPTQKKVTSHAITIYELKEGKVLHAWIQTDRVDFLQQIGLIPQDLTKLQQ